MRTMPYSTPHVISTSCLKQVRPIRRQRIISYPQEWLDTSFSNSLIGARSSPGDPMHCSRNRLNRALGKDPPLTTLSSRSVNGTAITSYAPVRSVLSLHCSAPQFPSSADLTSTREYPTPSVRPSRPSFDTMVDMARDCMEADGKDYRTFRRKVGRSRTLCLLRSSCSIRLLRVTAFGVC